MTSEQIEQGLWRLTFSEPEAEFIINTLARLGRHYQDDIRQMPPALRAYWLGTLTRGKADTDLQESQEILAESRGELRSDRLALVENWIREFELAEVREPWIVNLTASERDEFISMLNDRRMTLAFELGITERDMEADPIKISNEERRAAVLEIDFLGHFILVMLGPQIYRP